jgi:hypothetical protein
MKFEAKLLTGAFLQKRRQAAALQSALRAQNGIEVAFCF